MRRPFEDAEFRSFMASDSLWQRSEVLATTLGKWKNADLKRAAQRALGYLPRGARIHAKIYPMIKPQTNSFVFEIDTDPAIFLYLDPEITTEQLENTLAHEFHHIGYGGACPSADVKKGISRLPLSHQTVLQWIGAFGEGFAMLAAAGGPDLHPHQFSKLEDRERWDRDVGNFHENLHSVEKFFLDVLGKRLNEEQKRQRAFSFFGVQGPWYTVGWRMAVTIEQTYGRGKLIDCMCDQRKLLSTYNAAAERNRSRNRHLAQWSRELTDALSGVEERKDTQE